MAGSLRELTAWPGAQESALAERHASNRRPLRTMVNFVHAPEAPSGAWCDIGKCRLQAGMADTKIVCRNPTLEVMAADEGVCFPGSPHGQRRPLSGSDSQLARVKSAIGKLVRGGLEVPCSGRTCIRTST